MKGGKKRGRGCVPKHLFPRMLKTAIDDIQSSNAQNLKSGLKATGIHPLNRMEVLKRLPKGIEANTTTAPTPSCSFSEQLVTMMKQERYGESPQSIPKRRRLIDIQPGESVTEQQAQVLLAKKESSIHDENIHQEEEGRNKITIKQEQEDVLIPVSNGKPKRARKNKKAQDIREELPPCDENVVPAGYGRKSIRIKQERINSPLPPKERKKSKRSETKSVKSSPISNRYADEENVSIPSDEPIKVQRKRPAVARPASLKKRASRIQF